MHPLWLIFIPALVYQLLAVIGAVRHHLRPFPPGLGAQDATPGVSILKPLRGYDPGMGQAFLSHVQQDYPTFEILFGVSDPDDPAGEQVRLLQSAHPEVDIRLIISTTRAPNRKVGILFDLGRQAQYPIWVVNDSDILVRPDYLRRTVAPLGDPDIGLVTCLYRAKPHSTPAVWEALGIATDFMPSILVAPLVGVREFGLGSTLVFRAADLEKAGGFMNLAEYLADDYQLGKCITGLGKRVLLSDYIVETSLGDSTWTGVWQHQLRWSRTIRLTKETGYGGLPITHAGVWALIAVLCGAWIPAAALLAVRLISALITGGWVVRSPVAAALFWLSPLWDLYAFALWVVCYTGQEVRWRDHMLYIDSHGRIC